MAEERQRKALRNTALQTSIACRGYVEAVDTNGKTYWVDPKTQEIVECIFGDLGVSTARRYVWDSMAAQGRRCRRAAKYLWDFVP